MTVSPGVGRILEQVEAIDSYLANQLVQRIRIATEPIYDLFQRAVDGEVSTFEMSHANMAILSKRDERWFPIVADAMETQDAKLRDLKLYRLCELVLGVKAVDHELVGNVPHVWMLRTLLDTKRIRKRMESENTGIPAKVSRNYGLDFELALARGICLPLEGFVGPVIEARRKAIQIRDLADVPGDFAWSVEMLSRQYEAMLHEARKTSNLLSAGKPLI